VALAAEGEVRSTLRGFYFWLATSSFSLLFWIRFWMEAKELRKMAFWSLYHYPLEDVVRLFFRFDFFFFCYCQADRQADRHV